MEDYKIRMIKEYQELVDRCNRLFDMLYDYKLDNLEFTPKCSYELLATQQYIMMAYIEVLKERAHIEGIDLSTDITDIVEGDSHGKK